MTGKSRRELYAEQTRNAVIDAAVTRFARDGYAATTMDAIAEDARVAKGGLYHHFASKAELFETVFITVETNFLARVEEVGVKITDPLDLLPAGIDMFLAECSQPAFRRIALQDAPAVLGVTRHREIEQNLYVAALRDGLALLTASGQYAVPAGDLPARMLLAALGEAGLAVAEAADPAAETVRARAVIHQFVEGFRVPDPAGQDR
jgi:AcrR family transcriptional regulator